MTYRVVFMGTPQFAVPILEALVASDQYEILAVVTQPDRPQGRKKALTASPVKQAALEHDLLVLQPEKIGHSEAMDQIIAWQPDFIITAAFGQFLPTKLLDSVKIAAVNTHASLLPKYRGGAPVHYAIMNGEQETGVSIMYMVKEMDAGDVIDVVRVPIQNDDNVGTMFEKLSLAGRDLLMATLPKIASGQIQPVTQDPAAVTFSPNISHEQQQLHFKKETAQQLDWHIRGLYPTHPAYMQADGQRFKLITVKVLKESTDQAAGTIVAKDKKTLTIAAANHTQLSILRLQPAGKPAMDISAYLNGGGRDLTVGQAWVED